MLTEGPVLVIISRRLILAALSVAGLLLGGLGSVHLISGVNMSCKDLIEKYMFYLYVKNLSLKYFDF